MNKFYIVLFIIGILSCKDKAKITSADNATFIDKISIFNGGKIKIDSTLISKQNDSLLSEFYKKYDNYSVWYKKEYRNFIINEIKNCENDGLNPDDYNFTKLNVSDENYEKFTETEVANYDILLSKSARLYVSNIYKGKLNPYKLYSDWDLGKKTIDENKILFECIDNDNFTKTIESLKPNHFVYKQLQDALKKLNSLPDKYIEQIDLKEKITPGSSSKYVVDMKKKLLFWGDLKGKDSALTKIYDKPTQDAVRKFQKRHGLFPDAIVGKGTIEALNFSRNQRIEQVIVNMERWKWCANNLGDHYILVNIPDYKLVVYKDGDSVRSHKVVVGKESRRTPILSSKISNIVLNPTWTVPPTILKEDVFPAALRNKNAFRRKGLRILNSRGKEISPSAWTMATANRYRYVQNPSRNNSLGSMKIDFPNNYSVYLHDTNHRDLFVRNYRALSSGCVRVHEPLKLAEYIINDTIKWNAEKIISKTHTKPQKTEFIKITEPIYVHQFYWTSWLENNELQFREDIYCYDSDLYSKLRY
jgi:L,D-transpeptidase YcbB